MKLKKFEVSKTTEDSQNDSLETTVEISYNSDNAGIFENETMNPVYCRACTLSCMIVILWMVLNVHVKFV